MTNSNNQKAGAEMQPGEVKMKKTTKFLVPAVLLLSAMAALIPWTASAQVDPGNRTQAKPASTTTTPPTAITGTVAVSSLPPVTGTVNVGNLPTSQDVKISNTPSVLVANTTANPVFQVNLAENTRIPYESSQTCTAAVSGSTLCTLYFTVVPPNMRLVAQMVSGAFFVHFGAPPPATTLSDGSRSLLTLMGAVGPLNTTLSSAGFAQQITAYFDSGDQPGLVIIGDLAGLQYAVLTGYLENCSVTGCPTIVR
jgi:hypothetical protein